MLDCLTLCRAFLGLLLREVMSDDAAPDCAHNGVVSCVVSGHAANDGALDATGGMGGSGRGQSQGSSRNESADTVIQFHDGSNTCVITQ